MPEELRSQQRRVRGGAVACVIYLLGTLCLQGLRVHLLLLNEKTMRLMCFVLVISPKRLVVGRVCPEKNCQ